MMQHRRPVHHAPLMSPRFPGHWRLGRGSLLALSSAGPCHGSGPGYRQTPKAGGALIWVWNQIGPGCQQIGAGHLAGAAVNLGRRKVGIKSTLSPTNAQSYLGMITVRCAKSDSWQMSWAVSDYWLYKVVHSVQHRTVPHSYYKNHKFDNILDVAAVELDDKRHDLYRQATVLGTRPLCRLCMILRWSTI
jgi:hypothetical protein